jgi:hypothetical protein
VKISPHGGEEPKWRRDGKELFYISSEQEMMAVPLSTKPTLSVGTPQVLFRTNLGYYRPNVTSRNRYDVTADGQRFLMNVPVDGSSSPPITVVVNWTTTLNQH